MSTTLRAKANTWKSFDGFYTRAYRADLKREQAGDFDALRALMEENPDFVAYLEGE